MFPNAHHKNIGFYVVGAGSNVPFSTLMLDLLPNLHVTGAGSGGQFFPRWTYEKHESSNGELDFALNDSDVDESGYRRVDNITDGILALYRKSVGDQVTKDDNLHDAYGLHDPAYRQAYVADLKKTLPRLPDTRIPRTLRAARDGRPSTRRPARWVRVRRAVSP